MKIFLNVSGVIECSLVILFVMKCDSKFVDALVVARLWVGCMTGITIFINMLPLSYLRGVSSAKNWCGKIVKRSQIRNKGWRINPECQWAAQPTTLLIDLEMWTHLVFLHHWWFCGPICFIKPFDFFFNFLSFFNEKPNVKWCN